MYIQILFSLCQKGGNNLKHGKRLKRRHKVLLQSLGHDPDQWLLVKDTPELLEVVQRDTNKRLLIINCEGRIIDDSKGYRKIKD
jgi:hypothetical protein